MLTTTLLVALVLGQAVVPVKIIDPTQPSIGVTTSNVLTKRGLDVSIIGGAVTQGTAPWVTSDQHVTAAAPLSCRLTDGAAFYTAGSPLPTTIGGINSLSGAGVVSAKVSPRGGLNSTIVDGRDTGFAGQVSPIGDVQVSQAVRLVGVAFSGVTLDPNFWVTSGIAGTGAVSVSNSVATLATGVTANSAVTLSTNRKARFLFGEPNKWRAAVSTVDTGTANNVRRFGVGDGVNGLGFTVAGAASNLAISTRKPGVSGGAWVDTSTGLNGVLGASVPWTAGLHAMEISYFTAGTWWYLDGRLLHSVVPTTAPQTGDLNLPAFASNTNAGGSTTSVALDVWNMSILRLSSSTPRPQYVRNALNGTVTCKQGPGQLQRIIVNSGGAAANTITVYDNTAGSGTIIAVIAGASTVAGSVLAYNLDFYTGLTIVSATGTAADITVVFD